MIAAPAADVWLHLIDFERHGEWSTTFALHGRAKVGERGRVRFRVFGMSLSYPISLVTVDQARELRWQGGPGGIIRGSHYFRLEPAGPAGDRPSYAEPMTLRSTAFSLARGTLEWYRFRN